MTATSLSTSAPFKTKVRDFIDRNLDILFVSFMLVILTVSISAMGYSYEMNKKFARGMYIDANYERAFQGELNLKDIQILNQLGGTESLTEDWKYFVEKTEKSENDTYLVK